MVSLPKNWSKSSPQQESKSRNWNTIISSWTRSCKPPIASVVDWARSCKSCRVSKLSLQVLDASASLHLVLRSLSRLILHKRKRENPKATITRMEATERHENMLLGRLRANVYWQISNLFLNAFLWNAMVHSHTNLTFGMERCRDPSFFLVSLSFIAASIHSYHSSIHTLSLSFDSEEISKKRKQYVARVKVYTSL